MATDTSKLIEKAREAVQRRNYAYALDLYQQALVLDPDKVDPRRELRATASRYVKENGISPSSAWIKGLGSVFKILLMGSSPKNAEKLMIECEKFLVNDPGNLWVSTKLGLAALQLGYYNAAVAVFEDVRQSHPGNVPNLYHLGAAYEAKEDSKAAIAVYEAVVKLAPHEHLAPQKIKDLSAIVTTGVFTKGAMQGAKSIVKDDKAHEKFEVEAHEIRSLEQRSKALAFQQEALAKAGTDPRHQATYQMKIGDLWLLVDPDFAQAEAAYRKAKELQPTDKTYDFRLDDVEIKRMDKALKELEARQAAAPSDAGLKAEAQKLKAKRNEFRMKSYEQRAAFRPMDMNVAFTLGNIYFALGKLDEAIGQYQRTVGDPSKRSDSLNSLGICFSRKQQFDLAAKQFQTALDGIEVMNERKKAILYNLGDCLAKMPGRHDEALKIFTQLYEADIGFKDVAKRLEELRKSPSPKAG
ncbi:MAG TPA: tetratricopeptide repeat protein [Planctomycetota bacterium]|nr:tetratricopeptide repeat protein [Planctomycetota bacterium]